ncbi:MAG TPA: carboxymuconolactone decarboxylase family protein [Vicinamibacterales bacterium]|nr:carboxymuconolactone decarboxylase family protein [Vicinamibacterales bacterium]
MTSPYPTEVDTVLRRVMGSTGREPLLLFRLFATHPTLWERLRWLSEFQLGRDSALDLRTRELLIDRACARCNCEYEWGVHASIFGEKAKLTTDELDATAALGAPGDLPLEIAVVDQLHDTGTIDDTLWHKLSERWSPTQLLEMLVLVGCYHMVSFVANTSRLPLEEWARRFPSQR